MLNKNYLLTNTSKTTLLISKNYNIGPKLFFKYKKNIMDSFYKELTMKNYDSKNYILIDYFLKLESQYRKIKHYPEHIWLFKYMSNYLSYYIKSQHTIKLMCLSLKNLKKPLLEVWRISYSKSFLSFYFTRPWLYFYFLIQIIALKNITDYVTFIKRIIYKTPIKKHKSRFYIFKKIFSTYYSILREFKLLKGFRIYFKGKLGKKGSVKKSTIYFKKGLISHTSKNLRFNYKNFYIPTPTGVIGCYISIYYKC